MPYKFTQHSLKLDSTWMPLADNVQMEIAENHCFREYVSYIQKLRTWEE